jgi:hypothetical protein
MQKVAKQIIKEKEPRIAIFPLQPIEEILVDPSKFIFTNR